MRMSPEAVAVYARYADAVAEHVGGLRAVLAGAHSAASERTWLKHQVHGDLDDRLRESATPAQGCRGVANPHIPSCVSCGRRGREPRDFQAPRPP